MADLEKLGLRGKIEQYATNDIDDYVRGRLRQIYAVGSLALDAGTSGGRAGSQGLNEFSPYDADISGNG